MLVVPANSPARSVSELAALSKTKPNTFNYGSAASGSSGHLATELLKTATGLDAQHVAYKGGAPALTDLVGGRLDLMLINPLEAAPHVKAGTLRALAVSSEKRIAALPDTPTFAEAGVKGFEVSVWWAFLVPAATPKDVVAPLNADGLGRYLRDETQKWAGVIRAAKITAE